MIGLLVNVGQIRREGPDSVYDSFRKLSMDTHAFWFANWGVHPPTPYGSFYLKDIFVISYFDDLIIISLSLSQEHLQDLSAVI